MQYDFIGDTDGASGIRPFPPHLRGYIPNSWGAHATLGQSLYGALEQVGGEGPGVSTHSICRAPFLPLPVHLCQGRRVHRAQDALERGDIRRPRAQPLQPAQPACVVPPAGRGGEPAGLEGHRRSMTQEPVRKVCPAVAALPPAGVCAAPCVCYRYLPSRHWQQGHRGTLEIDSPCVPASPGRLFVNQMTRTASGREHCCSEREDFQVGPSQSTSELLCAMAFPCSCMESEDTRRQCRLSSSYKLPSSLVRVSPSNCPGRPRLVELKGL